jgi:hypothetical protein
MAASEQERPMTKFTPLFCSVLFVFCLQVASAQAQLVRTCVSLAKGSDANASSFCHCTTPCRTFATAAANTLANGEITVLDPGDYGGLVITRPISINNDSGGEASITVSGGTTGIIINAPSDAYVNLRGLTIQGVTFGTTTGLRFNTGLFLTMTSCVVRNHTGNGVEFFPTANGNLAMSNTVVADNGGDGIRVFPNGAGTLKADFDRVEVYNNSHNGISVNGSSSTGTINATATDSVAANNGDVGFLAFSASGQATTNLMVVRATSANNNTGLRADSNSANAFLRVGQSTVTANALGLSANGSGSLLSYGDNNVDGNTTDGAPTGPLTKK